MRHLPVHWYEGMFLRPQHFQAADRYWHELNDTALQWQQAYGYGLRHFQLDVDALSNYQVRIDRCHARLRHGTVVAIDSAGELGPVNLRPALEQESQVTVYVAVPHLVIGRPNVGANGVAADQRFKERTEELQDESRGGNDQAIQLRALNLQVLLANKDPDGYDSLPVARIKRAGPKEAVPQLDVEFIPPLLAVDAWRPLHLDILRKVYDLLGANINLLAPRVVERGLSLAGQSERDLTDLLILRMLNEFYATLQCFAFGDGVHPFVAYTELCRVVGALSVFGPTRRVADVPHYDHDDLARIFKWAKLQIESLLNATTEEGAERRCFIGTEQGMEVALDPEWLHGSWRWYVGVYGEGMSAQDCRDLLAPGNFDRKFGSRQQIDRIFTGAFPGLELTEVPQVPRPLPTQPGWVYYQVRQDGVAWLSVVNFRTLAMRFTREIVANADRLPGQNHIEVLWRGKRYNVQFWLFAIRPTRP